MEYPQCELLLEKDLAVAKKMFNVDFEITPYGNKGGNNLYHNSDTLIKNYFGIPYRLISIYADENEVIKEVKILFPQNISRDFYDAFNEEYGRPDHIHVIENRKVISESTQQDGDSTETLRKSSFDLREGTFEENPLFIIWKKDGYEIKAFMRHKQNMSEISFTKGI